MTALITAADLAGLRADAATALDADVTIVRLTTEARDALGGRTTAWADLATVRGKVRIEPGDERPIAGKTAGEFVYRVRLPAGTDVTVKDRLRTGGRTLEVVGVAAPRSHEVLRTVRAIEVR